MSASNRQAKLRHMLSLSLATTALWACSSSHTAGLSQAIDGPAVLSPSALDNAPLEVGPLSGSTPCEILADCDDANACTDALCVDGFCHYSPSDDLQCCASGVLSFYAFDPEERRELDLGQPGEGDVWALSSERALSPPTSLHFADPMQGRLSSDERIRASFELPELQLPFGADSELSLWVYADIETDSARDDLAIIVQPLTSSGFPLLPFRLMSKGAMPQGIYEGFTRITLPLGDFAGHALRLRFVYDSVVAPNPAREGIFIDDVEITISCPESELSDLPTESGLEHVEGEGGEGERLATGDERALPERAQVPRVDDHSQEGSSPREADAYSGQEANAEGGDAAADERRGRDTSEVSEGGDGAMSEGQSDSREASGESFDEGDSSESSANGQPSGEAGESASGSGDSGESAADPCAAPGAHDNCCTSDADCDDGNPETLNICEGAECVASWAPEGCVSDAECADAEACTLDRCDAGQCIYEGTFGAACCAPESLAIASFDQESLEGIYVTDNLETGVFWRPDPTRSTSGGFSLYCGDPVTQTYGIGERVKSSATTPVMTVAAGGQTQLHFELFMATRASKQLDVFQVFVLRQGVLTPIWSSKVFASGSTMGFLPVAVDLSHYAGQDIQLRFVFDSVDANAGSFEGIYLDQLRLETTCD